MVIQLRKFAEAVRRIKAAVSPEVVAPGRAPTRATGPRAVLSADVTDMLRTELTGIDPSIGGGHQQPPLSYASNEEPICCSTETRVGAKHMGLGCLRRRQATGQLCLSVAWLTTLSVCALMSVL